MADLIPNPGAPKPEQKVPEKNVFTELFGEDKAAKSGESGLLNKVGQQEEAKSKSAFGFKLGAKTEAKKAIGAPEKTVKKSKIGNSLIQVGLFLILAVGVFGYSQNVSGFKLLGVNPAQKAELAAEQVAELKTKIVLQNYLSSVLLLSEYSLLADEYFYSLDQSESQFTSSNRREALKQDAAEIRTKLIAVIDELQTKLSDQLSAEQEQAALALADQRIQELGATADDVSETTVVQESHDLNSTKKLLQSKSFRDLILQVDMENPEDEQIEAVWTRYNMEISQSVSAVINTIQKGRTDWAGIFDEFEKVAKTVDPLFNTEFPGNLLVDALRFNKADFSGTVSGRSVTDDTKNFTLVSTLVDELEASELFGNVEDRTYSKSTTEGNYESNFSIDFSLTLDSIAQ